MATLNTEVLDAFRDLGFEEAKARKVAEAISAGDTRLEKLDSKITLIDTKITFMLWILGIMAAGELAILGKLIH